MSSNKVFRYDTSKFLINDSEYRKLIEKSLRKLSKVLINDSFLGYESTMSHVEKFVQLLAHNREDYNRYYKSNFDKLEQVKKGFYCNKKGFTTNIEVEIFTLIDKINDLLIVENYKENYKSRIIFKEIRDKIKEFVLETNLIDREARVAYQKKIASVNKLLGINSLVSMLAAVSELKKIDKMKKENAINYQNLYLRNVNRFETAKDDFSRVKSYLSIKEKEILDLQFSDIEKLLSSENYEKFDTASDILDLVEEKFKIAVSGKKDRIVTYLSTEVDGLKGHVWEEDLQIIREGSEFIISEAQKSNDFNNLNLDKFKKDEKINSKKKTIDNFIKYLIDSSSDTKKEHKAKLARIIKQSETFYRRDVFLKEFEEFIKDSKDTLDGRVSKSKSESKSKSSPLLKWIVLGLTLFVSIIIIRTNASNSKDYNLKKGKKYINYVSSIAKFTKKSGKDLDKDKIRKRIFVSKDDLQILNLTDSTVTINYKGNILKANF